MLLFKDLDIVFHLHIPKSAGTSLRKSAFGSLPEEYCLEWNSPDPFDLDISVEIFKDILLRRPEIKLVSGHFPYGIHGVIGERSYKYFTVLRNPIDRIISNFRHSCVYNLYLLDDEESKLIIKNGFDNYLQSSYAEITYLNAQARLVSGLLKNEQLYSFDLQQFSNYVKNIIEKDYIHIGFNSHLSSTLGFLKNFFMLSGQDDMLEYHENIGKAELAVNILPQVDINKLLNSNSYDVELLNILFEKDLLKLSSNANIKDKDLFFSQVVADSALEMARQLRFFK